MSCTLRVIERRSLVMAAAVLGALGGAGIPSARAQASGTWSVVTLPQAPGQVSGPAALAADGAGNLYVADGGADGTARVQKYAPGGPSAPGDLDGDGQVTLRDATLALRLAVGLSVPTDAQKS